MVVALLGRGLLAGALLIGGCGGRAERRTVRPAVGYASYRACGAQAGSTAAACLGSVPVALRRPLRLPHLAAGARCPVSRVDARSFIGAVAGPGPVYVAGMDRRSVLPMARVPRSEWGIQQVVLLATSHYRGPVLVRGRRLGGPGAVGFGARLVPVDELQLEAPGVYSPGEPLGWRAWLALIRVRRSSCCAYQIDGTRFSPVIVFEASIHGARGWGR